MQKELEVLRAEIELALGAAEEEAVVLAQRPFGVFPEVPQPLRALTVLDRLLGQKT